ncbi:hypothetical protein MASSI9I_60076 [Massilia sp. 9I]|nr:hypothetical protein MASSI9I_60076 [Massilia sp. 9I]
MENLWDIHRIECAEQLLKLVSPKSVQVSSSSNTSLVQRLNASVTIELVEKIALIHRRMCVYYYYQFVYKLVYYNNKTNNASKLPSLPTRNVDKTDHRIQNRSLSHHLEAAFHSRQLAELPAKLPFQHFLTARLWKSRGISTGSDVQNTAIPRLTEICPSFVQAPHKVCAAGKRDCKSLMLWSKRDLSTEELTFTIYYQIYIYVLVN